MALFQVAVNLHHFWQQASPFRRDEARIEVDHHHAVVLLHQLQDIVRHIARVRRQRECRRMRGDQRRLRDLQGVPHGVSRDVRNVHEHAEAIHLAHDVFAERCQAVVPGNVSRGISPIERIGMRQRHVASAERMQHAQDGERVIDGMAAFDADERRDLAGLANAHDVVRGVRHLEGVGIRFDEAMNDVDLLERLFHRGLLADRFGVHIRRPELCADTAFLQAFDIGMQQGLRTRDIEGAKREVGVLLELPGQIVVPIDE